MQEDPWKLVGEWAALNSSLEKIWEPGYALLARRTEIERQVPWLKGHGASPAGNALPKPPFSSLAPPPRPSSMLIDPPEESSSEKKKMSRQEKKIRKMAVMQASPGKPETKSLDQSQSFQGNPDKN